MKTVTNSFILNLAAADILFAATMPLVAYVRTTTSWHLGDLTCKILPYIQVKKPHWQYYHHISHNSTANLIESFN